MRLVENWRSIVKRAWSIRLLIVAGALSGIEALLSILNGTDILPPIVRIALVALTPLVIMAAFVARLVAQKSINPKGAGE
jgi:hypothetical protein